jgi:uncharacterized protein YabN with tetrapyrrole methylase and pyrophosphatase domain
MHTHNGKTYVEGQKHDMAEFLEIIEILRSPEGCSWTENRPTRHSRNV